MSTSRTESRCHEPSDSGSKSAEPLNAVESIVAKHVRLQSVGLPQHDAGCGVPSGFTVRPP